jgi:hypothetical protein
MLTATTKILILQRFEVVCDCSHEIPTVQQQQCYLHFRALCAPHDYGYVQRMDVQDIVVLTFTKTRFFNPHDTEVEEILDLEIEPGGPVPRVLELSQEKQNATEFMPTRTDHMVRCLTEMQP